jgi:hypothetical protein
MSFAHFLEWFDKEMYTEYLLDTLKSKPSSVGKKGAPISNKSAQNVLQRLSDFSQHATPITSLPNDHPAKVFIQKRCVPKHYWSYLYWTEDFATFTSHYVKDMNLFKEPRIIIPFEDEKWNIQGFQGRSLSSGLRYITIKIHETSMKIYGRPFVKRTESTVYIMEGVFDAMVVPNSIAMLGSDISHSELVSLYPSNDLIYVYDNEPRNREIVRKIQYHIQRGHKVVIWPKNVASGLDINQMAMNGLTPSQIQGIMKNNTYSGLKAKVYFQEWKKV